MMPRDFLADDIQTSGGNEITPRDFLAEDEYPKENLAQSLLYAAPRVGSDLIQGAVNFGSKIPGYLESAKTEIPGAMNQYINHPINTIKQELAGSQEGINQLAQAPLNLAEYGNNRLNLVPNSVIDLLKKISPEDTTNAINQIFAQPSQPGEELLRGLGRNAINTIGGAEIGGAINPLRLTESGIAKNVLKEERKQVLNHNKLYNGLWEDAQKAGVNEVPYNVGNLILDFQNIKKYTTPKQYKSLIDFANEPTLSNAQKAQSDLGQMKRSIEEKGKTSSLLSEEKNLYNSLSSAENNIESNMFKNANGEINQELQDRYKNISRSYRDNVVPYKYNKAIQAYKDKKITKSQFVNALRSGEFAAKKAGNHPAISIRNNLLPLLGTGLGGAGLGYWLYKQLNSTPQ